MNCLIEIWHALRETGALVALAVFLMLVGSACTATVWGLR